MAQKVIERVLALVLVTMLCHRATAQSSCTTVLIGLSPCLNYITGNSSTPSSSCCSQLASAVQSQPQCLCAALNAGGSSALGITINQTLALSLPGACNVQTPPLSRCNAANGPATSPVSSPESPPADSSNDTPDTATIPSSDGTPDTATIPSSDDTPDTTTIPSMPSIPSGTTSKTVPSTTGSTSNASNMKMSFHLTVFALFLASCISRFIAF